MSLHRLDRAAGPRPAAAERGEGDARPSTRLPRLTVVLVSCAALVVTAAGIRAARDVLGPIFLALILVVTVAPIGRGIRARRGPAWLATACVLFTLLGIVAGLEAILVYSVGRLATIV